MSNTERTYIMIKPDGVQRGLIGQIIARFEKKGFKLVALKLCSPSQAHLEKHYADLSQKKFFPGLIQYMLLGPVCCMVWEGLNAVKTGTLGCVGVVLVLAWRWPYWYRRRDLVLVECARALRRGGSTTPPPPPPHANERVDAATAAGLVHVYVLVLRVAFSVPLPGRVMLGATNPADSAPGTIRGDLCVHVGRNICHGSDSVESAEAEIALWFSPEEINAWTHHSESWVYE